MSPTRGPVVAVIPARAGSVGVPGKNLREVGGVPLVARAVASALAAASVDHVVVSTDGARIADVASAAGADVILRPAALSTGSASSESAVTHALDVLEEGGIAPSVVVFLQATSPFTRSDDIDDAVARVLAGHCDVVLAAARTHAFLWTLDAEGRARGVNHDPSFRPMRQDREPEFQETGAFYVMDAAGFRRSGHRFFGRIGIGVTPDAVDIDTEEDLAFADAIARSSGERAAHTQPVAAHAAGAASSAGASASDPPAGAPRGIGSFNDAEFEAIASESGLDVEYVSALSGLAGVEAVVTDFDGVHTDDGVLVDQNGVESVTVNRRDGLGVRLLREAGIPVLILSTEKNPVVGVRAAKLGVQVLQGIDDKATAITRWAADAGIRLEQVAYLGNDINDLGALGVVGWPFAVADAHPRARAASRRVLSTPGGAGAVRELAELILKQKAAS